MSELNDLLFQLNGGWPAVIVTLVIKAIGVVAIGFLFHLGWNLL